MALIGDRETFNKNISRIAQMFGNIGMTKMEDRLARQRMAEQMKGYMDLESQRSANSLTQIEKQGESYMSLEKQKAENDTVAFERALESNGSLLERMRYEIREAKAKGIDPTPIADKYREKLHDMAEFFLAQRNNTEPSEQAIMTVMEQVDKGIGTLMYQGGERGLVQEREKGAALDRASQERIAAGYVDKALIEQESEKIRQFGRHYKDSNQNFYTDSERKDAMGLVTRTMNYLGGAVDPEDPNPQFRNQPTKNLYPAPLQQKLMQGLSAMQGKLLSGEVLSEADLNYINRVYRRDLIEKFGVPRASGLFPFEEEKYQIAALKSEIAKRMGIDLSAKMTAEQMAAIDKMLSEQAVAFLNEVNGVTFKIEGGIKKAIPPTEPNVPGETPRWEYSQTTPGVMTRVTGLPQENDYMRIRRPSGLPLVKGSTVGGVIVPKQR